MLSPPLSLTYTQVRDRRRERQTERECVCEKERERRGGREGEREGERTKRRETATEKQRVRDERLKQKEDESGTENERKGEGGDQDIQPDRPSETIEDLWRAASGAEKSIGLALVVTIKTLSACKA